MKNLFLFVIALLLTQLSNAQWDDDYNLSDTPDTSYVFYGNTHTLAAQGDTVHVVWYDKSEGNWDIVYKRSTDGGETWESNKVLNYTIDGTKPWGPSIAVSGPFVFVFWWRSAYSEIFYTRSPDRGETWEEEVRFTNDISVSYEVIIATSGAFVHVAWVDVDNDGIYRILYKNSPDNGVTWGDEQWLSANSPMAWNPTIAADGSDVGVAWNDQRDLNYEIYFSKSSNNGSTWGPETRLTNDLNIQLFPSIALSGQSVHLAWMDERFGWGEICYKGSTDGGATWGEEIRVTDDPAASSTVNLAVSGSVIYLVWQDWRSGYWDIYYNYSTDGGYTWNTDTQLNDFSFMSYRPHIAVSGNVLHTIWYDYRDYNYEIYYKRNPTGGMVGLDEQLRAESAGLRVYPNPASRQLTVGQLDSWAVGQSAAEQSDVPTLSGSAVRLSIFDLFGREVKEYGETPSYPFQVDISGLPDGVYILRMMDEEGNEEVVKFMKIKE